MELPGAVWLTMGERGQVWAGAAAPDPAAPAFNPFLLPCQRPHRHISGSFRGAAVFHLGMRSPELGFGTVKYL